MQKAPQVVRQPVEEQKNTGSADSGREADFPTAGRKTALECFPAEAFREGQREAIEQVDAAFASGFRYVILEAPTGVGKSYIAMAFALAAKAAHVLTVQKILQQQYSSDFGDRAFVMKGRNAYECLRQEDNKRRMCSEGPCRTNRKIRCEDCPYQRALGEAHAANIVVHNFDSFYYQRQYAGAFSTVRELLIVDEAHNIENKFLNFMSFSVSNKTNSMLRIPKFESVKQYAVFLREQYSAASSKLLSLRDLPLLTSHEVTLIEELNALVSKLAVFLNRPETTWDDAYVCDYEDHELWQTVVFRPIFVGEFVEKNLFDAADRVLMLSATFLDKDIFCESIGIPPGVAKFIALDSCFPAENRPIVRKYAGSMNYANIDDSLPKAVARLEKLLLRLPNTKGIVQTHSEKIANYIQRNLFNTRLTFRRDFHLVEDMLAVHASKPGSFLVASGLREGIDLKGDLSQVQVIMKVPYPDLGDKRVQRRKALNPQWYGYLTALAFVQILGRSVRSKTDKAITYIFDESFEMFYRMNRRFIPKYVREAIRGSKAKKRSKKSA